MGPKILFYDVETAPSLGWFYDRYKENAIIDVKADWYVLSFAYKWAGQKKVTFRGLPDYRGYKTDPENDKALMRDIWGLLDEADIVVAHNGDRFDLRKCNARFVVHGLPPPSPYRSVDTLKLARKHFKFDSNRLDALGGYLKVGRKLPHNGAATWLGCMQGDPRAWKTMGRYNIRDVELLESVYYKLRPWATTHPALTYYTGKLADCPKCESANVEHRGWNSNRTGRKKRMVCRDCGGWFCGPQERRNGPKARA